MFKNIINFYYYIVIRAKVLLYGQCKNVVILCM
jgi:hypothetical protein